MKFAIHFAKIIGKLNYKNLKYKKILQIVGFLIIFSQHL